MAENEEADFYINCGNTSLARGDLAGAAENYRAALSAYPANWIAQIKLAHVLKLAKDYNAAEELLQTLMAQNPDNPAVHKEFGRLYFARERMDDADKSFKTVLHLTPHDADAYHWLANIENLRGNAEASQAYYQRSVALRPLMRVPGIKTPPDFSVLFLFAPGGANTPPDALIRMAEYDSYFLLLIANVEYDAERLRSNANVVFNLISDVDQGREILPVAANLIERIGLPVINHPRAIMKTDRQACAELLTGIPFCRAPRVRYYNAAELDEYAFPLLLRVAGTHGGKDFEKVSNAGELANFVAEHPGKNLYVTQYVDYQSADEFFRKYRFIFVGGEILPYHLAIDKQWKVHHATTDMANQLWMQKEEEDFLNDSKGVFHAKHWTTLHEIRKSIGLDFFGIDCAIDREDNLVVFEVNASMLVHHNNENFAYKNKAVENIKKAFDAMLKNTALQTSAR